MGDSASRLEGQTFGRLTVIERAGSLTLSNGKRRAQWRCRCSCGAETLSTTNRLTMGNTRSCGCLMVETQRLNRRTHGAAGTRRGDPALPEYGVWVGMRDRCCRPSNKYFANYGGRGITVCERWREDFAAFLADMGARPSEAHSIDRIDNNAGYSPENCRWATRHEQTRNTRRTRLIAFRGETLCLLDWAARIGIAREVIAGRLNRGWSVERALTAPRDLSRKPRRPESERSARRLRQRARTAQKLPHN